MKSETTNLRVKKATWKRIMQIKLDEEFSDVDEIINSLLDARKKR